MPTSTQSDFRDYLTREEHNCPNRRVRNRMHGGVGGRGCKVPSYPDPCSLSPKGRKLLISRVRFSREATTLRKEKTKCAKRSAIFHQIAPPKGQASDERLRSPS